MRAFAVAALLALLAACGGAQAPAFAGHWREAAAQTGTGYELVLTGNGTTIAGSGVLHRPGGGDAPFTVSGSSTPVPGHGVTFEYSTGQSEGFAFDQPDPAHLQLQDAQGSIHSFLRL